MGRARRMRRKREGRSGVGEDTLIKEITRRLWKEGKVTLEKNHGDVKRARNTLRRRRRSGERKREGSKRRREERGTSE